MTTQTTATTADGVPIRVGMEVYANVYDYAEPVTTWYPIDRIEGTTLHHKWGSHDAREVYSTRAAAVGSYTPYG